MATKRNDFPAHYQLSYKRASQIKLNMASRQDLVDFTGRIDTSGNDGKSIKFDLEHLSNLGNGDYDCIHNHKLGKLIHDASFKEDLISLVKSMKRHFDDELPSPANAGETQLLWEVVETLHQYGQDVALINALEQYE